MLKAVTFTCLTILMPAVVTTDALSAAETINFNRG